MREEVGVDVTDGSVRYVANQPWPFPQSSMIGFRARADPAAKPLAVDAAELDGAGWFSRAAVEAAAAAGRARASTTDASGAAAVTAAAPARLSSTARDRRAPPRRRVAERGASSAVGRGERIQRKTGILDSEVSCDSCRQSSARVAARGENASIHRTQVIGVPVLAVADGGVHVCHAPATIGGLLF